MLQARFDKLREGNEDSRDVDAEVLPNHQRNPRIGNVLDRQKEVAAESGWCGTLVRLGKTLLSLLVVIFCA